MTITIDDTYLLWGGIHILTTLPTIWLVRKIVDEYDWFDRLKFQIAACIPIFNLVIFIIFFIVFSWEPVTNVLKYVWNIHKNARLLQTTLHENKQLKQDNAIFQKMLQSGLDYETAKAYIENDDEYFRTKYHKIINLDNGCLTIDDHKLWKRK